MGIQDELKEIDRIIAQAKDNPLDVDAANAIIEKADELMASKPVDLKYTVVALNELVRKNSKTVSGELSVMQGLECVCAAFGFLLDVYAKPNDENSEGMCDDPAAFRAVFADMLVRGGA